MRRLTLLLTNLLLLPFSAQAVIINGSDLLGKLLEDTVQEFAADNGIPVAFELKGSINALEALEDQDAHIALYTDPGGRPPESYSSIPIAFQVVALAVHERNPVGSLNYEQLAEMIRANGRIEEWGSLTEDPEWSTRSINLGIIRNNQHLAMDLFRYKILQDNPVKSTVDYSMNPEVLVDLVRSDNSSLVILPAALPHEEIKYLALSQDAESQSYLPSMDNVLYGDYPLRLPFYLVWNEAEATTATKEILRFFLSDQVAEQLQNQDYMPLPESERASYRSSLE